jgi:zinc/manganese transport system ATP-binding protein
MTENKTDNHVAVELRDASLTLGSRTLWHDLSLTIKDGEFIAVLGPNGAGKSTLLKTLLGLQPLSTGSALILGKPAERGNTGIGYIPQQKNFDPSLPLRGRDLVQLGLNGSHFGIRPKRTEDTAKVDKVIADVGATAYANNPIGLLSGGEQQRLRIAQALVSNPRLLLCDEPLLSLDLASQQTVTSLIHEYRQAHDVAVIFVTHEINPILPVVDKVLYIANGKWLLDTPEKVLQSKTLSELYESKIEVLNLHGRVLVVGVEDAASRALAGQIEGHHV